MLVVRMYSGKQLFQIFGEETVNNKDFQVAFV